VYAAAYNAAMGIGNFCVIVAFFLVVDGGGGVVGCPLNMVRGCAAGNYSGYTAIALAGIGLGAEL